MKIKELVFAAGLEGVDSNKQLEVEELILNCLKNVVSNGISEELVQSSLHQLEIKQREITGSGMPYGLQIMLGCLPACLHNDDPLKVLDLDASFDVIKNNLKKENYIENLIEKKIINNQQYQNLENMQNLNLLKMTIKISITTLVQMALLIIQ